MSVLTAEELARRVVAATAPAELPTFDVVAAPYLEDPARAERRLRGDDTALGFGLGDLVEIATPVVALVSGSVVSALSDGLSDAVRDGAGKLFRKVTRRKPPEVEASALSGADLAEVRQVALGRAKELGLPADKAEALADSIVVALLLGDEDRG
jgi:hypothetical protein